MTNIPTYPDVQSVTPVEQCLIPPTLPKTPLRLTLFLYSPIASVVGTPSLWYAIPLTQARVPVAGVVVILIEIIVQFISLISGRKLFGNPPGFEGIPNSINMSISDLAELLTNLKNKSKQPVDGIKPGQVLGGDMTRPVNPEVFTAFLLVNGFMGPDPDAPRTSFWIPLFAINGITGGLPIIILGLISTLLIRQVVTPEESGVEPVPEPQEEPKYELKLQEILHLLKRFGGNFK